VFVFRKNTKKKAFNFIIENSSHSNYISGNPARIIATINAHKTILSPLRTKGILEQPEVLQAE
jgi:hypothetical protein